MENCYTVLAMKHTSIKNWVSEEELLLMEKELDAAYARAKSANKNATPEEMFAAYIKECEIAYINIFK